MSKYILLVAFMIAMLGIVLVIISVVRLIRVPEGGHTASSINAVQRAVHNYVSETGKLPTTLEDMDKFLDSHFSVDGWGHPMILEVGSRDLVIGSFGRDGVPGGEGENRDMFRTFDCFDENGMFFVSEDRWLTESVRYDLDRGFNETVARRGLK